MYAAPEATGSRARRFTAGDVFRLASIDKPHFKAPLHQQLVKRNPVNSGGFIALSGSHCFSQCARAHNSPVKAPNRRTPRPSVSRPGGTAAQCSSAPMSMPAALRLTRLSCGGTAIPQQQRSPRGLCALGAYSAVSLPVCARRRSRLGAIPAAPWAG
jgi:hypothetical protein